MTFQEAYNKYSDDEFLKFDRVQDKLSSRSDMHAFIWLDRRFPGGSDLVSAAGHDEIWLSIETEQIDTLSEAEMVDLIRCGLRYSSDTDSLAMFV